MRKGILVVIIGIILSAMMPFSIFADTQILPSYNDNTTRTNFQNAGGTIMSWVSDPLTTSTWSRLSFTFDDHYYGYVTCRGYFGNTSTYNDFTVFIADGYGEWNYRNVSNGSTKYINDVRVDYVNLVIPDSSVDLTQIINLLTAIEVDTTAIDSTLDSTLTAIQSVLNQLIISNGYLDVITQMREYNFPIESFIYVRYALQTFELTDVITYKEVLYI